MSYRFVALRDVVQFAYANGYHEHGFDIIGDIEAQLIAALKLAVKVDEWNQARLRFVDHGFMGDAHEADRLGAEIVTDAQKLLSLPSSEPNR